MIDFVSNGLGAGTNGSARIGILPNNTIPKINTTRLFLIKIPPLTSAHQKSLKSYSSKFVTVYN